MGKGKGNKDKRAAKKGNKADKRKGKQKKLKNKQSKQARASNKAKAAPPQAAPQPDAPKAAAPKTAEAQPTTPQPTATQAAPPQATSPQDKPRGSMITVDPTTHRKTAQVSGEKIAASQAVISEWGRRVEAEYRSAAITQHLTLWLIQMGASPDLIHDGLRIVTDELAHAQLSHETFVDAGGEAVPPIARESLALKSSPQEPLEAAITRYGVEVFCLGETVAVPLFKVLREACVVPSARRALDRVLKDEVRHRDFGWTLLEYLVSMPCEPLVRQIVNQELPGMFSRIRRSYAPVGGEQRTVISEADRAWGLMPIATYGQILERTLERDYRPRFNALGFDIEEAWTKACAMRPTVGS